MIVFDSSKNNKWKGNNFEVKQGIVHLTKNASIKQGFKITQGTFKLKLLSRRRTGLGNLYVKIKGDKDIIFQSKLDLTTGVFSEQGIEFTCNTEQDACIEIYTDSSSAGTVEVGKVNISKVTSNFVRSSNKDKILVIVPYKIYGGAEVYIENIIKYIPASYDINVVCLKQNMIQNKINKKNVFFRVLENIQILPSYIKNLQPKYIIYYNSKSIYDILVSLKKEQQIVSKMIEIYHSDFTWPDALSLLSEREYTSKMIAVGEDIGKNIDFKKDIVPVGLDINLFQSNDIRKELGFSKSDIVIGTVARLSKEKRIDYLIQLSKILPYKFLIVGDGPELTSLKKQAGDNVTFVGYQKNVVPYLRSMNAFVLASTMEGTPISIIEAMLSKVKVYSNFVGGISNILKDEYAYRITGNEEEDAKLIASTIKDESKIQMAYDYAIANHNIITNTRKFMQIITDVGGIKMPQYSKVLPGDYI